VNAAKRSALSPAMLYVLGRVRDGEALDGRSWRAIDALERRGLIALHKMPATGPVWSVTAAGQAALEAIASTPGMPGTVYGDGIYVPERSS
jgi:hypothetical protein